MLIGVKGAHGKTTSMDVAAAGGPKGGRGRNAPCWELSGGAEPWRQSYVARVAQDRRLQQARMKMTST
jgi:hypothetical protein